MLLVSVSFHCTIRYSILIQTRARALAPTLPPACGLNCGLPCTSVLVCALLGDRCVVLGTCMAKACTCVCRSMQARARWQTWCARAPVRIQCSVRECAARAGLCLLPSRPPFGEWWVWVWPASSRYAPPARPCASTWLSRRSSACILSASSDRCCPFAHHEITRASGFFRQCCR